MLVSAEKLALVILSYCNKSSVYVAFTSSTITLSLSSLDRVNFNGQSRYHGQLCKSIKSKALVYYRMYMQRGPGLFHHPARYLHKTLVVIAPLQNTFLFKYLQWQQTNKTSYIENTHNINKGKK